MKKTKTLWLALAMLAVGLPAFGQLLTADRVTRNQLYPNNVQLRFGNSINGKIYSDGTDLVIDALSGTVKFPHGAAVTGSSTTTIPDNTATAYQIKEGTNNYFKVTTTNSSEAVTFGNATTNPLYTFLGTGTTTLGGALTAKSANFNITDNQTTPFAVGEGNGPTKYYLQVRTIDGSEDVTIGNAITNPTITVAGSGAMTVAGPFTATTSLKVGSGAVIEKYLKGVATIDFPSTNAQLSADSSGITVTGAVSGDICTVGAPAASVANNSSYSCYVSASDTVKVRLNNYSSGAVDPASGSFTVAVIHLQ